MQPLLTLSSGAAGKSSVTKGILCDLALQLTYTYVAVHASLGWESLKGTRVGKSRCVQHEWSSTILNHTKKIGTQPAKKERVREAIL